LRRLVKLQAILQIQVQNMLYCADTVQAMFN
jgi:hypothetical protein